MKKKLQVIGSFNGEGVFEPTHLVVTKSIAEHELNSHLDLIEGIFIAYGNAPADCPPDTADGYYIKSGGNCVYVPYG